MRPRLDTLTRLSRHTGVGEADLVKMLEAWPQPLNPDFHCIVAGRIVRHGSTTTTTARLMVETALGEPLSPSWRLKKLCPTADCVQPNHYTLESLARPPFDPLPPRLFQAEIDEFTVSDDEVLGAIESLDDFRTAVEDLDYYDPAQVSRLLTEHYGHLL